VITHDDIKHIFKYHAPSLEQVAKYAAIREAAKELAYTIIDNTSEGPDQSAAIRKLRECVMTANASIALE